MTRPSPAAGGFDGRAAPRALEPRAPQIVVWPCGKSSVNLPGSPMNAKILNRVSRTRQYEKPTPSWLPTGASWRLRRNACTRARGRNQSGELGLPRAGRSDPVPLRHTDDTRSPSHDRAQAACRPVLLLKPDSQFASSEAIPRPGPAFQLIKPLRAQGCTFLTEPRRSSRLYLSPQSMGSLCATRLAQS